MAGSKIDNWRTPDYLFKPLHTEYEFELDVAADHLNKKVPAHFTEENSALDDYWGARRFFMNPPFSQALAFFYKLNLEVACNSTGVALYRCDNLETKVWQEAIFPYCDWIFILSPRVQYVHPEGKQKHGVKFGSALIGYGVPPPTNLKGTLLWMKNS